MFKLAYQTDKMYCKGRSLRRIIMDDTATHNDSSDSVDARVFLSYNAQQS